MNIFVIIALISLVALTWRWLIKPVKPVLARSTDRPWLASRGKTVAKSKLAPPS
jgi:hypothetical protein